MNTSSDLRRRAVSSLGLSGFHAPKPTGVKETDDRQRASYEEAVQGRMDLLRGIDATTAAREQEGERQRVAQREEAQAAEKAQLRATFMASNRGATDEDFERVLPTLRDQAMVARTNELSARAKTSGRYSI